MSQTNQCPQCGVVLAADAPRGLCPECLLRQALPPVAGGAGEPEATTPHRAGGFEVPDAGQLAPRFAELEILELLGQGGMGAVYKARQKMLDRTVALKILPPEVGADPAFAERFAREARALAKLAHPNIVVVHECGERDGLYYLLMEYVDGVNLRQAIRAGSLSPAEALAIVQQICDALQYAHDEGVVHRDIKPENVLLDRRNRVKIADFGLAKLLARSPIEVTLTASHQVMGTLHYMAPEQIERPLAVDHRADIYSLGVVFYELLTGELPLGRFKLPSEKKSLDARLDNIVLKTLERDPERRYQHASDVKTDVEHLSSAPAGAAAPPRWSAEQPPARICSVPFTLSKHKIRAGHGVARFDGRQLALEFEVLERATLHSYFADFKPGLHEAAISVTEIASASLDDSWFRNILRIQTHSVRAATNIPGSESGMVELRIASRDWDAAEELVEEIEHCVAKNAVPAASGPPTAVEGAATAAADHGPSVTKFHSGRLGMAFVMLGLGIAMLVLFNLQDRDEFLFIGIGLILGGAGVAASAFSNKVPLGSNLCGPHPGTLVMGAVMVLMGAAMFGLGIAGREDGFFWVGFGLTIGGGGCFAGAWKARRYPHRYPLAEGAAGKLAMAAVMLLLGTGLFIAGWLPGTKEPELFVYIGMGILFGGAGCLASAWKEERISDGEARGGKVPLPAAGFSKSELAYAAALVRVPAICLILNGCFNLVPALVALGWLIYGLRTLAADVPMDDFVVYVAGASLGLSLLIFVPVGFTMIVAGSRMLVPRSYGLAVFASVLSTLPCHPAFFIGLPIGIWSLRVLLRSDVKAAFD